MLSSWFHSTKIPTSPPLHSGDKDISVQIPPLWTVHSPQGIHQGPKTSHRALEGNRHSWVHHQQQEIFAISYTGDRIFWDDCELSDYGDQATRAEGQNNQTGSPPDARPPTTYSTKSVPAFRETKRYQPSPADGTSLLSFSSGLPQTNTSTQSTELSGSSQSLRPSARGSQMVGATSLEVEWE